MPEIRKPNMKPGIHRGAPRIISKPSEQAKDETWQERKRISPHKRGYDRTWQRFRDWYLARNPICCIREKCSGAAASELDHIKPLRRGGARLDTTNVQSACKPCHSWKTATHDRSR